MPPKLGGSNNKCPACGKSVFENEKKVACGQVWHELCFCCTSCKKVLRGGNYKEKDNTPFYGGAPGHSRDPYCDSCYEKAFGPEKDAAGDIIKVASPASPQRSGSPRAGSPKAGAPHAQPQKWGETQGAGVAAVMQAQLGSGGSPRSGSPRAGSPRAGGAAAREGNVGAGAGSEVEVTKWIEAKTGERKGGQTLQEWLKSGQVLCKLANAIQPDIVDTINTMNAPFKQKENIEFFIVAASTLGVPAASMFAMPDLYDDKNMGKVITALHVLQSAQK